MKILIALIVLLLLALVLWYLMRQSRLKQEEQARIEAQQARERVAALDERVAQRQADAEEATGAASAVRSEADARAAEAEERAAEARRLQQEAAVREDEAAQRQRQAEELARQRDEEARRADALDPGVRTDDEGRRLDEAGNVADGSDRGMTGKAAAIGAAAAAAGGAAAAAERANDIDDQAEPVDVDDTFPEEDPFATERSVEDDAWDAGTDSGDLGGSPDPDEATVPRDEPVAADTFTTDEPATDEPTTDAPTTSDRTWGASGAATAAATSDTPTDASTSAESSSWADAVPEPTDDSAQWTDAGDDVIDADNSTRVSDPGLDTETVWDEEAHAREDLIDEEARTEGRFDAETSDEPFATEEPSVSDATVAPAAAEAATWPSDWSEPESTTGSAEEADLTTDTSAAESEPSQSTFARGLIEDGSLERVQDGGYGMGSAAPVADGFFPLGHPVKGRRDSQEFAEPGHDAFDVLEADVWFTDAQAAYSAGFHPRGQ